MVLTSWARKHIKCEVKQLVCIYRVISVTIQTPAVSKKFGLSSSRSEFSREIRDTSESLSVMEGVQQKVALITGASGIQVHTHQSRIQM